MKKYCKDIDITDRQLISRAVYECLEDKLKRRDTIALLSDISTIHKNELRKMIEIQGKNSINPYVEKLIDDIRSEIIENRITFKPVVYRTKTDESSGKIRRIGIQNIKQQLYDYIAVEGLKPVLRRIGEFQCASIKGRGQIYGVRTIQKWLRNKDIKYAGKADISKCYESITHENMMKFLRKYVKNDRLMHLVELLINSFEKGLSIGSYLSQFLCNLYMSQLYHYVMERLFHERRKKDGTVERVNLVKHMLLYVDDILILSTSEKYIKKAMKLITEFCQELGLKVKPTWITFKTKLTDKKDDKGQFIDMMGFRIYRWHVTIRRRIFKRIRKYFCRLLNKVRHHKGFSIALARKIISYFGFIKNTDSFKIYSKYKIKKLVKIAKRRISNESKISRTAACC